MRRLLTALSEQQQRDGCGNKVFQFIVEAMKPVRFLRKSDVFDSQQIRLNQVLVFVGVKLGNDGHLRQRDTAQTLSEAEARAGRLKSELLKRNVHPNVLRFCRASGQQLSRRPTGDEERFGKDPRQDQLVACRGMALNWPIRRWPLERPGCHSVSLQQSSDRFREIRAKGPPQPEGAVRHLAPSATRLLMSPAFHGM